MLLISANAHRLPEADPVIADLQRRCDPGIHLRTGYVSCEWIEPMFKACDVVALPYERIGQSGVLNLAKAFQRPVVVTDAFAEAAEIDATYGRAVPVNDKSALAQALSELLSKSEAERAALGALGLCLGRKESWEMNAAAVREVCARVMTASAQGVVSSSQREPSLR